MSSPDDILGYMIPKTQTTFIVDGGLWKASLDSSSAAEAAAEAFHCQYLKDGAEIQVAPYIEVLDVDKLRLEGHQTQGSSWFYTPLVMADAGYHGLSSSFYTLLEELSE